MPTHFSAFHIIVMSIVFTLSSLFSGKFISAMNRKCKQTFIESRAPLRNAVVRDMGGLMMLVLLSNKHRNSLGPELKGQPFLQHFLICIHVTPIST